ncbi:MAG: T9SS type A sorting domain-containing protein [Prevotella sp.]|nr:T9SS type A sorting domain-containing protein [Prevotella sp.]
MVLGAGTGSTKRRAIGVTSTLREAADVRIYSTTGNTIANFTIQPGETIERHIPVAGVYIVRADGGRIQKKLMLK